MTESHDTSRGLTRRDALRSAAALCGVGLLAAGAAQAEAASPAAAGISLLPDGRVKVSPAKVPALKRIGGKVVLPNIKGAPAALVRTGQSSYVALNLRCPHAGATVSPTSTGFTCPSHGSRFAPDGDVTQGPAARDLAPLRVTRSGRDLIVG